MKNELKYSRMLENAGLSREQAESHLRVIEGAMLDNVATKADIEKVRTEIGSLEYKIINKLGIMMGVMMTSATAVLSGVAALLKFAF